MFSILRFTLTQNKQESEKKEAKYNLLRFYIFGKASKSFQIESLFPFHSMQWRRKKKRRKSIPKGTVQKPKISDFVELSALLMCVSPFYYYYFVQDDHYFSHKSNVNQYNFVHVFYEIISRQVFVLFCKLSAHKVSLGFLFNFEELLCFSCCVIPTIVIALTIRK